jgi:hypothetical protein
VRLKKMKAPLGWRSGGCEAARSTGVSAEGSALSGQWI